MTVFYRGRRARITHDVFESRCPEHRAYRIRELHGVHIVAPASRAGPPGTRVFAASSVAVLFLLVPAADGPAAWLVGSLLALVLVVGLLRRPGRPREPYELRAADRGGGPVVLFSSPDLREFGQVSRALKRVLEQTRDG